MAKNKQEEAPVKYYELVDKKGSGFIMDGTKGTAYQQELNAPSIRWIPTKGKGSFPGDKGVPVYKEIRYLSGSSTIDVEEQKKLGLVERPFEDKIPMDGSFMTVVRAGDTVALYDYMEKAFYNKDNPDRSPKADAIYQEVKLNQKATAIMDQDEEQTKAKTLVYSLRINTGDVKKPYKFNIDRIDAICRLVGVWDETPETKLLLLLNKATQSPKQFLELVVGAEQVVITEVAQALELKVISRDGAIFKFEEDKKVIIEVENTQKGDKAISEEVAIKQFSAWLGTEAGTPVLTEIRTRLEIAKQKQ